MKLWTKIKNWITKPYIKPLRLTKEVKSKEVMIKDLEKKTKKELESIGRKMGIELDRRLTKQKLINKIKFRARNKNR
jgi:cytochrome c biogenesis protein ResB